jgi:predicted fused transcriptional regulator/phosphomethylpyrimidine kinase
MEKNAGKRSFNVIYRSGRLGREVQQPVVARTAREAAEVVFKRLRQMQRDLPSSVRVVKVASS